MTICTIAVVFSISTVGTTARRTSAYGTQIEDRCDVRGGGLDER
jgi:hypothetical protein